MLNSKNLGANFLPSIFSRHLGFQNGRHFLFLFWKYLNFLTTDNCFALEIAVF